MARRKPKKIDTPAIITTICFDTGKRGYDSRADAKLAAKRTSTGVHLSQFVCQFCDRWHNGNLPSAVKRGRQLRDTSMQARRRFASDV